jgi:hypothetical protein
MIEEEEIKVKKELDDHNVLPESGQEHEVLNKSGDFFYDDVEGLDNQKPDKFLFLLLFATFSLIAYSLINLFLLKNYDLITEINCDPNSEHCFYRPCDVDENECYPNNLSYYRIQTIKSRDFKYCENEDCTVACNEGLIKCVETLCSEEVGDICVNSENYLPLLTKETDQEILPEETIAPVEIPAEE